MRESRSLTLHISGANWNLAGNARRECVIGWFIVDGLLGTAWDLPVGTHFFIPHVVLSNLVG